MRAVLLMIVEVATVNDGAPRLASRLKRLAFALTAATLVAGCSVQRYAINSLGDMLSSGDSVYASDDDPELVEEALPFGLKLIEGLLAEQPEHRGLLLAAARGYLLYTRAFVDHAAERVQLEDIDRALTLRSRARNLYLRAHSYARRALELDYPGIGARLVEDPARAVTAVGGEPSRDVPGLYFAAAALGLAISSSTTEPALLARLPEVESMLQRALMLDESWNEGALHEFAISVAAAQSAAVDEVELREHYERALELSGGRRPSVHVAFAEAVAVPRQDRALFVDLLERALSIDPDALPSERLLSIVAQRRAAWLLDNADEIFLE